MHKITYFFFLMACFGYQSCSDGPGIDIPFRTYVTIGPGLNTGLSHYFRIEDIQGADFGTLQDAQPAYVTLSIEYGESNLDFVEQAFLLTVDDNGVQQEMAYQTHLPINNYSSEQLYPSILNMSEHISQPSFDMQLKLIFRAIPTTETRIRVDFGVRGILAG